MTKLAPSAALALATALAVTACSGGNATPNAGVASDTNLQTNSSQRGTLPQLPPSSPGDVAGTKPPHVTRIFVGQFNPIGGQSYLMAYGPHGTPLTLVDTCAAQNVQNIVFDQHGDLFVTGFGNDVLATCTPALKQEKSPISVGGTPVGDAVGPNGKLFVTTYPNGSLVTFAPNGTPTTPTIAGPGNVTYVAVDAAGKIYITDSTHNILRTYKPDGTPTTPTITQGLNGPGPIVVDANGKIYVTNSPSSGNASITTYTSDGTQTTPTIAVPSAHGIAVAQNGDIYITDSLNNAVRSYTADGSAGPVTITGLTPVTGIALRESP